MVKYKYIIKAIEKSYSHAPHLGSLPYDRRSNDPEQLQERIDEIDKRIEQEKTTQEKLQKELEDVDYHINQCEKTHNTLGDHSTTLFKLMDQEFESPYSTLEYHVDRINNWELGRSRENVINTWEQAGLKEEIRKIYNDLDNITKDYNKIKRESNSFYNSDYDKTKATRIKSDMIDLKDNMAGLVDYTENLMNTGNDEQLSQVALKIGENNDGKSIYGNPVYNNAPDECRDYLKDITQNIEQHNDYGGIDKLKADKKQLEQDISLSEKRVKDYKGERKKTSDKKEKVTDNSWIVELSDGQKVDMNGTVYMGDEPTDLKVEDILYDPYDRE